MTNPYDAERERILAQVPQYDAAAFEKAHADTLRSRGQISQATRDDWLRMIRDPSYPLAHRQLIHNTAKEALARIGEEFAEPEPTVAKGE